MKRFIFEGGAAMRYTKNNLIRRSREEVDA